MSKAFEAELMTFGKPNAEGRVFILNELSRKAIDSFLERVKAEGVFMEISIPPRLKTPEEITKRYSQIDTSRIAAKIVDAQVIEQEEGAAVITATIKPEGPQKANIIKLLSRKCEFSFSPRIWANAKPHSPAVEVSDILTFDFAGAAPTRK